MSSTDFLVIGAGIAGASAAYWLAEHGQVTVLERETQPGYHATGRSAALFAESYGTPLVRSLTRASRAFYAQPPDGFTEQPILAPRGILFVASRSQGKLLEELGRELRPISPAISELSAADALRLVPALDADWLGSALLDPQAMDIDVHSLHQGYLRGLKRRGGSVHTDAEVTAICRNDGLWHVTTARGEHYAAPLLINAAGAWCDSIAGLAGVSPIGLQPKRRSAFVFAPPPEVAMADWPAVIGVDESFYVKPDAGQLLGSPANADPVPAHDVQAEELDIATGIWRIEEATTLTIRRPTRVWAGLRSFVADGDPVAGFATTPGFFWLAAQGGYGIQTAHALGRLAAALAIGDAIPAEIAAFGVDAAALSPQRLQRQTD
jgi:D-arginine dehydrogenase